MKKIILFVMFALCLVPVTFAQDFTALKEAHINSMKYFGHGDLVNERNPLVLLNCEQAIASAIYTENIATAYMEKEGAKIYWYVEKIENGVLLTIKVTVGEIILSKSFKIIVNSAEIRFTDLDYGKDTTNRFSVDWACLASKVPGCIVCTTNWICWLGCAGSIAYNCIKWRGVETESRGFDCPKCGYPTYYYRHYCSSCGACSSGSSLKCSSCYSQKWTNGKQCPQCGLCYK
jgi:hypothetical protein